MSRKTELAMQVVSRSSKQTTRCDFKWIRVSEETFNEVLELLGQADKATVVTKGTEPVLRHKNGEHQGTWTPGCPLCKKAEAKHVKKARKAEAGFKSNIQFEDAGDRVARLTSEAELATADLDAAEAAWASDEAENEDPDVAMAEAKAALKVLNKASRRFRKVSDALIEAETARKAERTGSNPFEVETAEVELIDGLYSR